MSKKLNSGKNKCCDRFSPTCFGKRCDAFFCYNDDKAKLVPSIWHPMNPQVLYRNRNHSHIQDSDSDIPHTSASTPLPKPSPSTSQQQNLLQYKDGIPPPSQRKLRRNYLDIRDYLRNCMYRRLNINWTEEDDTILIKCIHRNLVKVKGTHYMCQILDEIVQKSQNVLFNDFVLKVKDEFYKNGQCGQIPAPVQNVMPHESELIPPYQSSSGQPSPQVQSLATAEEKKTPSTYTFRNVCYICGKIECICTNSKTNVPMKCNHHENEAVKVPKSSSKQQCGSCRSNILVQSKKWRNNESSDDESECEMVKIKCQRLKHHNQSK